MRSASTEDGKESVKLKPDWPKGYMRKGLAEFFLEKDHCFLIITSFYILGGRWRIRGGR